MKFPEKSFILGVDWRELRFVGLGVVETFVRVSGSEVFRGLGGAKVDVSLMLSLSVLTLVSVRETMLLPSSFSSAPSSGEADVGVTIGSWAIVLGS